MDLDQEGGSVHLSFDEVVALAEPVVCQVRSTMSESDIGDRSQGEIEVETQELSGRAGIAAGSYSCLPTLSRPRWELKLRLVPAGFHTLRAELHTSAGLVPGLSAIFLPARSAMPGTELADGAVRESFCRALVLPH